MAILSCRDVAPIVIPQSFYIAVDAGYLFKHKHCMSVWRLMLMALIAANNSSWREQTCFGLLHYCMLCFIPLLNAGREHPTDTMCPLRQAGAGRCRLSSPWCGSWALVLSFYCRRGAVHVVGSIVAVQHPVRMQGLQRAGCSGEAFLWLVGHNSNDSRNQIFEQSLQTGMWSKRCFVSRFKSL